MRPETNGYCRNAVSLLKLGGLIANISKQIQDCAAQRFPSHAASLAFKSTKKTSTLLLAKSGKNTSNSPTQRTTSLQSYFLDSHTTGACWWAGTRISTSSVRRAQTAVPRVPNTVRRVTRGNIRSTTRINRQLQQARRRVHDGVNIESWRTR